jgi:hypothetical protein
MTMPGFTADVSMSHSQEKYSFALASPGQNVGGIELAMPNFACRTPRGVCPITCYPITDRDGRVIDWFCICDCRYPIPDANFFS